MIAWPRLAVFVLLPVVSAQDATPRGVLAGWVRGADGKRVVGAAVTLVSQPIPGRLDLGTADVVRATTEPGGMFRAELRHGRAYTAWATFRDATGSEQRSEVLEAVVPGPPRELLLAPAQVLRRVRVEGAAAWSARAPLCCTVFAEGENPLPFVLALDADGVGVVPTLPGGHTSIEVRGRDGFVIASKPYELLAHAGHDAATIALPAPRELRVTVVDEQDRPIAGARVHHALSPHGRNIQSEVGRSGVDGVLVVTVPATNTVFDGDDADGFSLVIEAPGRQRQRASCSWKNAGDGVRIRLPAGIPLRGRLLGKDGKPVRGVTVLPDCYAVGSDAETTGAGVPIQACPVDDEGRFTFDSLHPQYDFRLLVTMEPATAIAAGMPFRPDVAIAPVLWLAVGRPAFRTPHDLGDLRLDQLTATCIEVTDHAGTPVPYARLVVTTRDLYVSPAPYVCDRVGRLQFVLPEGEIRVSAWVPGGGVATRQVVVPPAADDPPLQPLRIPLSATRTVRGVVVDEKGEPVAGATVYQHDRAHIEDRALREVTFHSQARSEPTGADGVFTLTLPLAESAFAIQAWFVRGETSLHCEHMVGADDDDGALIRLPLAPWRPKR